GQIISNLIRNAFKFTKEGGVTVFYDEIDQKEGTTILKITVSDTGIGIPEDRLNEVFERFTQVESGYTKNFEGSGLGLSIAKSLVSMQGGTISVKSIVGEGTAFSIQIPMLVSSQSEISKKVTEIDVGKFKGKKLLIVEDNTLNVMVLQKMLSTFGFEYETAQNGSIAVDKVLAQSFDLILMDIHMPVMDGIEASKKIHEAGIETPIIGLSANVTRETMIEALDAGMKAYLTKPFSKNQILEVFSLYLN
ncbi:MAG: response regulator, partial [Salibacteraceae bacterium]|nr:response regulator [Salibacteraceae bacterium]